VLLLTSFIYLDLWQWGVALMMTYVYVLFGGTIGLHRLFSHGAFTPPKWFKWMCGVFATLIGAGSLIQWIALHRHHHKHSDTKEDPHNAKSGLFNLLLMDPYHDVSPSIPKREWRDPFFQYFHYTYWWWHIAAFSLLLISVQTFLMFYVIPSVLTIMWVTFSVYYIVHIPGIGYKNYEREDTSENIGGKFMSIITGGESLHNNHHETPRAWDFAHKDGEYDFAASVIRRVL
jgi:stearoyl-CoA desaturase (delta-9 desaturase)